MQISGIGENEWITRKDLLPGLFILIFHPCFCEVTMPKLEILLSFLRLLGKMIFQMKRRLDEIFGFCCSFPFLLYSGQSGLKLWSPLMQLSFWGWKRNEGLLCQNSCSFCIFSWGSMHIRMQVQKLKDYRGKKINCLCTLSCGLLCIEYPIYMQLICFQNQSMHTVTFRKPYTPISS